jgi:dephospho-CoA kinase|tara:strand:- start:1215 stop:1811 length:597 start_codon:yes stop_codon:yes gene_type:complete
LIIGLTGGIASGKSTVASTLGTWGAYVIDADKLGHSAYISGTQAFTDVVAAFGDDIVGPDGEVDRRSLGGKVFGNPDGLKKLTDIVWPAIMRMAEKEIATAKTEDPSRVVVLEAAVLIEADWLGLVDQVWVTVVEPSVAIERASARDGVDAAAVQARIDAQLSNDERIAKAHEVVHNAGDENHLIEQIRPLWSAISAA